MSTDEKFSLDDLSFTAEWMGVLNEVAAYVAYSQDQYITKHVRWWCILPLIRHLIMKHLHLMYTNPSVKYTDRKTIIITQKVALIANNWWLAKILLKEPKILPED